MTTIRPEIVSLFVDIDWEASDFPVRLVHNDGRPFTPAEHGLIQAMRRPEIEAAERYFKTAMEYHQSCADAMRRLAELTDPYFDKFGAKALMMDVLAAMPEAELVEAEAILDQWAPDGFILRGDS